MRNKHVETYEMNADDPLGVAAAWERSGGEARLHGPGEHQGNDGPRFHLSYAGKQNRSVDFGIEITGGY